MLGHWTLLVCTISDIIISLTVFDVLGFKLKNGNDDDKKKNIGFRLVPLTVFEMLGFKLKNENDDKRRRIGLRPVPLTVFEMLRFQPKNKNDNDKKEEELEKSTLRHNISHISGPILTSI